VLGNRFNLRLPEGGFFLWLDVGDGEAAALKLWREAGIRVLPGAYMGRETEPGNPRSNPGFRYIRVALVHELSTIEATLGRLVDLVGEPAREMA
jgi:N-succinyldiaminopimelate aminotransferase